MEDFLTALFTLTVGGSLTAGLLMLLRAIPNKLPRSFYYYAWLLVLLRMALPIPGLLTLPQEGGTVIQMETPVPSPAPRDNADIPELPAYTPPAERPEIQAAPETPVRVDLWQVLGALWAAGFAVSLGRDLFGYFRFRRSLKRTLLPPRASDIAVYDSLTDRRRPRLCRSRAVDSPMLMGLLRPTLLLPDLDYAPETLTCIFLHELTHYRRRDILYKWFTMAVLALHWFNPVTIFMRRDIERCCELSCDERILRKMSHDQRRNYGQTLLVLAARSAPAKTALSTSFSTEKKKLKERLVQIMTFTPKSKKTLLIAAVLLLAVALCGILLGPAREVEAVPETTPETTVESAPPMTTEFTYVANDEKEIVATQVTVSTVDELLTAIHSDTVILLEPGTYDLTTATGYGERSLGNYSWAECYDGFMLNISNVSNLTITGKDKEGCEIVTQPRYAPVLRFMGCKNISLNSFTAGHTPEQGACTGAVIYLDESIGVTVSDCILYGCGTYGVQAHAVNGVNVWNCDIKECSHGAVHFMSSDNVEVENCRIFDCGEADNTANCLFNFDSCLNTLVQNCTVTNCYSDELMSVTGSGDMYFLGNQVKDCTVRTVFNMLGEGPRVMDCSFDFANKPQWFTGGNMVMSPDGEGLDDVTLAGMEHKPSNFQLVENQGRESMVDTPIREDNGGVTVTEVSTVDEFLAAIAPDTVIILGEGTFDLSTASDYARGGGDYYTWKETTDGYYLELHDLYNFHISGQGKDKTVISAVPRYANVLVFRNCQSLDLNCFTAGHTEEPGVCAGGVLYFEGCQGVNLANCGLYGCGTIGIHAFQSSDFIVGETEIYDCSVSAIALSQCSNMYFGDCNIHDVPEVFGTVEDCQDVTYENFTVDGEFIK